MITEILKKCQKQFILKTVACMLAFAMAAVIFAPVSSEAATKKVKVYYNGSKKVTSVKVINYTYQGKKISLGNSPVVCVNGTNMAPYTMVFVKNGPKAKHSLRDGTLILKYNGITLKFINKSKTAYVNGKKTTLSAAPVYVKYASTKKSYFMIPMKKTCQLLGLNYKYVSSTNTAAVTVPSVVKTDLTNAVSTTETTKKTESAETETVTKATAFKNMTTTQFINYMGPIARADMKKSGVLASVTLAQCILESGWGKSELAQKANNMFGMKISLSGNTWKGSTWDGKSKYTKKTGEELNGKKVTITASFRSYPSVEKSVADHSAYLLGAKNGSALRYAGLAKATTYTKQIQIIKNGGYATSSDYVTQVCNLIKKYNLTKWDK